MRRVADSEGKILGRVGGLMGLITLVALLSAGLTVWSLTAATMMERRGEIAIMQAIGAARWMVATLFGLEIALVGLAGGVIGAIAGVLLAHYVGASVFQEAVEVSLDPAVPDCARGHGDRARGRGAAIAARAATWSPRSFCAKGV